MKLTCDEATEICDKNQYKEASLWEKAKLGIHLFLCNKCGLYSKQNTIITKCFETHKEIDNLNKNRLGNDEKEQMEKELMDKL